GIAVLILTLNINNPKSITFITVLLSFICIVADLSIAISKSIPLNHIINNYPSNNISDMHSVRSEWLSFINYRGAIAITGLLILISGYLIESYTQHASVTEKLKAPKSSHTAALKKITTRDLENLS